MKTVYTDKDYNEYMERVNSKKVDFIYLLNGVSNMTVPKEIENSLKSNNLYEMTRHECYKSIFEVMNTHMHDNKCITSPMNNLFISYRELSKTIRTHYEKIDNILKLINPFEIYELSEIRVAIASLFINLLKENKDDIGIIVEPWRKNNKDKLTLLDPDIIIDINSKIPVRILEPLRDLGSKYELLVEMHYNENDLIKLIDEENELENWILSLNIRKKLLTYKEDVKRLNNYIFALKNYIALEKSYE